MPEGPPPPGAIAFLGRLEAGGFDSIEVLRGNLKSLNDRPAMPLARLRITGILIPFVAAVIFGLCVAFAFHSEREKWDETWAEVYPGAPSLSGVLRQIETHWAVVATGDENAVLAPVATEANRRLLQLQIYAGLEFRDILADDVFWRHPDLGRSLSKAMGDYLKTAREVAHAATRNEEDAARVAVTRLLASDAADKRGMWVQVGTTVFGISLIGFALLGLAVMMILGQPLLAKLCGLLVVDRRGRPATRIRLFLRWLFGWVLPVAFLVVLAKMIGHDARAGAMATSTLCLALLVAALGFHAAWRLMRKPWRGWQDTLSGTYVTAR